MSAPLPFTWDGEAMIPLPAFQRRADKQFVIGQRYRLDEVQERSMISHNHYFAVIAEAWSNLPEQLVDQFPNAETLRQFALIRTSFCTTTQEVCASHAEAQRAAAMIRRWAEKYLLVRVERNVVTVYRAESQSIQKMGKKRFQESKDKVLDYIATLIGVTADELKRAEAA